jgi:hypothetical protein
MSVEIWGGDIHEEGFSSIQKLKSFLACVMGYWNSIAEQFYLGALFSQLLYHADHTRLYPFGKRLGHWLTRGMTVCKEVWLALMDHDEYVKVLFVISALANEHHPNSQGLS